MAMIQPEFSNKSGPEGPLFAQGLLTTNLGPTDPRTRSPHK